MSLKTNLANLITQLGTDYKIVTGRIGDLSSLATSAKGSLVAALNEINAKTGSTEVNDSAATSSTTQTYSASKITSLIAGGVTSAVNQITGGAGTAYDTLVEIQAILQGDDASIATIMTALGKRLRVDDVQTFTAGELTQAQSNLSVYSRAQLGDPETDLVALYTTAKQ